MRQTAFALYLVFVASWFLHLTERFPVLGQIRFDLILVVLIVTLIVASTADAERTSGDRRIAAILAVLAVYVVVSLPLVQWPGSVLWFGIPAFVKAAVFYLFTRQLVNGERRLRALLVVFLLSQTFRVVEPVYLHATEGYWGSRASMANWEFMNRLAGAPSDVINPNGLAFVILTIIPLWHYLGPLTRLGTFCYLAVLPVSLYALTLTGSRSGMLGLAVVIGAIWLKTRRKIIIAVCVGTTLMVALPYVSEDLQDRYLSIFESGTKNAASAEGRLRGVLADLDVGMRRPLFGHGLGTSREANANFAGEDIRSHNLYAEVVQELGFVGLAIFLAFMLAVISSLRAVLKEFRRDRVRRSMLPRLADSLQVLLAMNVIFSFASYGLSSYEWYFMAGLCETVRSLSVGNHEIQDTEKPREPAVQQSGGALHLARISTV